MTVCILYVGLGREDPAEEVDSGAGITKEVPSKIHELHADAAELTRRRSNCDCRKWPTAQNREVTRTVATIAWPQKFPGLPLPVELFAEIQINKSQWGIQRTK